VSSHAAGQLAADAPQFLPGQLDEERQDDVRVLKVLADRERRRARSVGIRRLAMDTHDAAPGGDSLVQHVLHHPTLIAALGQPDAVALPIGACPAWFEGESQSFFQISVSTAEGCGPPTPFCFQGTTHEPAEVPPRSSLGSLSRFSRRAGKMGFT